MSQQKVDRYKKDKANRKSIIRKQKIKNFLWKAAGIAILAALVIWLGYSGYTKRAASQPRSVVEADVTSIADYMTQLDASTSDTSN